MCIHLLCRFFLVASILQTECFKPPQHIPVATATANTPNVLRLKDLNHLLPVGGVFRLPVNEAVLLIGGVFEHLRCHRAWNVTKKTATVLNVERTCDILRVWLRHNGTVQRPRAIKCRVSTRALSQGSLHLACWTSASLIDGKDYGATHYRDLREKKAHLFEIGP